MRYFNHCKTKCTFFSLLIFLLVAACCTENKQKPRKSENSLKKNNATVTLTPKEELGKRLFFEEALSTPEGQSCATCHDPAVAFSDPEHELPVSRGAVHGLYGNRNDMPVSYAAFIPPLHKDEEEGIYVGGLFWDGRANSLADQAKIPLLNPIEMGIPDTESLLEKLKALDYSDQFISIYGPDALSDAETAFNNTVDALEAFQKTPEVNPFTSKYDYWLKGQAQLTEQEMRGLELFEAEDKGNCAACHPHQKGEDGSMPLFTDFTYDNLGVPKNPELPFYSISKEHNPDGYAFVDVGLETTVNDPAERGKFRVPTLRNVAVTPPYMHNGVFKTLFQVTAFYNSRDIGPWPEAEVKENVNKEELGNLGLTNSEIEDLVAFMKTLTDGWTPESE